MSIAEQFAGWLSDRSGTHRGVIDLFAPPPAVNERFEKMRAWAENEARPLVEAADADDHTCHDKKLELLKSAASAGLLTNMIPGLFGGKGSLSDFGRFGGATFLPFVEELGAVSPGLSTLIGAHYLGLMPILLAMDIPTGRRLLKPICTASPDNPKICAFAITEPGAGSDAEDDEGGEKARLGTFAKKVKGGYVLNGRKCFISGGNLASVITVFAALDPKRGIHSWTCFAVTPDMQGFSVGRVEDKMGQRASPAAELVFEDVFVPEKNRVGRENDGWRLNGLTLDTSRPAVAGIALGGARGVLRELMAWIEESGLQRDRYIQAELAELIGRYQAARALTWRSSGTFPPRRDLSAYAKFIASDNAMHIASKAMDLLGEEGGLRRRRIERLYRDIKLTQIYEGTNQINRLAAMEEFAVHGVRPSLD